MRKMVFLALASIVALGAAVALAIYLVTRPAAPGVTGRDGAGLASAPPSAAPLAPPAATPATGAEPVVASPGADPAVGAAPPAAPARPAALRGQPVVPLPADPAEHAAVLESARQERLARMLEERAARARRGQMPTVRR